MNLKRIVVFSCFAFVLVAAFSGIDLANWIAFGGLTGTTCGFILFLSFKWKPLREAGRPLQLLVACLITYGTIVTFRLAFDVWAIHQILQPR
jgi:Na+/proline symporter